ncbi:MAG: ketopantoate reductase family protein [Myxococcales bacterium]|nr:ketopantoate reductase family protein [Myxococcales bacterium]
MPPSEESVGSPAAHAESPRVLVVGCGGIGGTIAAQLTLCGTPTTVLSRNELIVDAINRGGFQTRGDGAIGNVPGHAVRRIPDKTPPFDYVLLATQPPQVEQAARDALRFLADDGRIVCFQNGLCELRVAEIAGEARVVGGIVSFGATMLEPGVYDRTSSGGFVLGRLDGDVDAPLETLARLLEAVGPVAITTNLQGARWSKLAINCAISSLGTLGGDRVGPLLNKRFVRRLALEIMTETVHVARASKVSLEKVSGTLDLDWLALTASERDSKVGSASLVAKHALLVAVGTRYRRLRSSMLNAIERGRPPAVDFLNGEVVERGKALGVATPVNTLVREWVWQIARGKERPGVALLERLYALTRAMPQAESHEAQTAAPHDAPHESPPADPPAAEAPHDAPHESPPAEAHEPPSTAT